MNTQITERYSNGVQMPKELKAEAAELVELFGEPTGWNCPDNAIMAVLLWNPRRSTEEVRDIFVEKYGPPSKDTYSSGWTSWPDWTDWKRGEGVTFRILKTGPRSCRVGLVPSSS